MRTKNTLTAAAAAVGLAAMIGAGLAAPAAFAESPSASSTPTPEASSPADGEQPTAPIAELLEASGIHADNLAITPGAGEYTVTADAVSLANGATSATLSVGDDRMHTGGVTYVGWFDVSAANDGQPLSIIVPVAPGAYTVTLSAAYVNTKQEPQLTNLLESGLTIPAR